MKFRSYLLEVKSFKTQSHIRPQGQQHIKFVPLSILTMTVIQKVAIAGASSDVGQSFLQALIDAGFEVTVLVRAGSNTNFPSSVKTATVDYTSVSNLTSALQGQDALVSNLGNAAFDLQENLIDAVVAAKVKRFLPSDYGCDMMNPNTRKLPVFAPKVKVEDSAIAKLKGTESSWTIVYNNAFLDWGIENKLLMDLQQKKFTIYDGGEQPVTVTPVPFVGKGIAQVLKHPDETANRVVKIHGASVTQKKLLEIAQRVVGSDGWDVDEDSSANAEKRSYELLNDEPGNPMAWVPGFLKRGIYGKEYGGDFSKENDNQLLGLEEISEKDIEDIVRKLA